MTAFHLPKVQGPHDLPELRSWLIDHWRPGGSLSMIPDARFIAHNLPSAKLWWVDEDATALLAAAAPTMPDDVVLDVTDLPTPCGLAVFAHDLLGTDADPAANGKTVYVSALMWAPSRLPPVKGEPREGVSIFMFSRLVMDDGLSGDQLVWAANDLGALDEVLQRRRVDRTKHEVVDVHGDLFAYVGRTDWLNGWTVARCVLDNPHGADPATVASMAEDRKLVASLWSLAKTPFVQTTTTRPPHHVARRSERKGLEARVHVLRLHAPAEPSSSPSPAPSTITRRHSWVVAPHWRWQAHGPGRSLRKLILIPAHRRGPEDLPLLGGDRVWRVAAPKPRAGE